MKKYLVKEHFVTTVAIEVEAENEDDAREKHIKAVVALSDNEYARQVAHNCSTIDWDIKEIK